MHFPTMRRVQIHTHRDLLPYDMRSCNTYHISHNLVLNLNKLNPSWVLMDTAAEKLFPFFSNVGKGALFQGDLPIVKYPTVLQNKEHFVTDSKLKLSLRTVTPLSSHVCAVGVVWKLLTSQPLIR